MDTASIVNPHGESELLNLLVDEKRIELFKGIP